MKLDDYPTAIKEGLAYHEAFRRLGFPPDDIYFATYASNHVQIQLKSDGKTFRVDLGMFPARFSQEEIGQMWAKAVELWNTADSAEAMSIWNFSHAKNQAVGLLMRMQEKGFRISKSRKNVLED